VVLGQVDGLIGGEVGEANPQEGVDEHVLRLDVTVDNAE